MPSLVKALTIHLEGILPNNCRENNGYITEKTHLKNHGADATALPPLRKAGRERHRGQVISLRRGTVSLAAGGSFFGFPVGWEGMVDVSGWEAKGW